MEPIEELREEVRRISAWYRRHDRVHLNADERLNILLRHLDDHTTNHHGRRSTIRQSSLTVAVSTALLAVAGLALKVTGLLGLVF